MASVTIVSDLNTQRAATPSAASVTKYNAATGPITDVPGMLDLAWTKAKELKLELTQIKAALDAGDPIVTAIQGVLDSLV